MIISMLQVEIAQITQGFDSDCP